MKRKCFLVAEPVPNEGISTRKLLLETAYYNVVTAYDVEELFDNLAAMSGIDAIVIHSELMKTVEATLKRLRGVAGDKPVILLTPSGEYPGTLVDAVLPSHQPHVLLSKLQEMYGSPQRPGRS